MVSRACIAACAAWCVVASFASAGVFDLTSDFSESANPNWQWSFTNGGTPLQKFTSSVPNSMNNAAGNGMWTTSAASNYQTSVLKVTADGPAAGLTVNDFLAGDVIAHGTNQGGSELEIRWGGQVRGTVTVTGKTWYAHSFVNRVGRFELRHNTGVLASGNVAIANNRPNPINFGGGGTITLQAGDTIRLAIGPAAGQPFAPLMGVDLTINFTPHPCPPDITFGAIPGQPGFLEKNGIVNNDDFFAFLGQFSLGNLTLCDLTTGAIPGSPGYGVPNGLINNDDFFYYLSLFAAGC